jgi:hypothetical protein
VNLSDLCTHVVFIDEFLEVQSVEYFGRKKATTHIGLIHDEYSLVGAFEVNRSINVLVVQNTGLQSRTRRNHHFEVSLPTKTVDDPFTQLAHIPITCFVSCMLPRNDSVTYLASQKDVNHGETIYDRLKW